MLASDTLPFSHFTMYFLPVYTDMNTVIPSIFLEVHVNNRPGVAGAVLHRALLLIQYLSDR